MSVEFIGLLRSLTGREFRTIFGLLHDPIAHERRYVIGIENNGPEMCRVKNQAQLRSSGKHDAAWRAGWIVDSYPFFRGTIQRHRPDPDGFVAAGVDTQDRPAKFERRHAELLKWSLVFRVSAVGSIAVLAGVLR